MKIITLFLSSAMLIISASWLHTQPTNELFVWTIRNDAAETIAGIVAAICAFAGMMLMVNINGGQEMNENEEGNGYWCVVCGRFLKSIDGVITHDDIIHPVDMNFDEEEKPQ